MFKGKNLNIDHFPSDHAISSLILKYLWHLVNDNGCAGSYSLGCF
jgi:hypothetical protein